MKLLRLACLAGLLCAGCAPPRFTELPGQQAWLTTPAAIADDRFSPPVYWQCPARPYHVLGGIQFNSHRESPLIRDLKAAAKLARQRGGDALLIQPRETFGRRLPPLGPSAPALVIKWKSLDEVDEAAHRLDGLRAYLRRSYPALDLSRKPELWALGVDYVTWLGLDVNSPLGSAKLEDRLSGLIPNSMDQPASKWLFKGTLHRTSPTPTPEVMFFGSATLTGPTNGMVLISDLGEVALKVEAATQPGQWHGHFHLKAGASVFTGLAEGAVEANQISFTLRGGSFHGTLRCLR